MPAFAGRTPSPKFIPKKIDRNYCEVKEHSAVSIESKELRLNRITTSKHFGAGADIAVLELREGRSNSSTITRTNAPVAKDSFRLRLFLAARGSQRTVK